MKIFKRILVIAGAAALLALAARDYLGHRFFKQYQAVRARAKSIESGFPEMERNLKRAVAFYGNPVFHHELGRLYLERAVVENEFGTEENRDSFLDRAAGAIGRALANNPIDASAFYDLGRVYMLYNDPVPIYQDKARRFFRRALELDPADEFLNANILFIFLAQWDSLDKGETAFLTERLKAAPEIGPGILPRIRKLWTASFGDTGRLKDILSPDESLWKILGRYF
jgi:tetratricopeptide (TPR) repeat protein